MTGPSGGYKQIQFFLLSKCSPPKFTTTSDEVRQRDTPRVSVSCRLVITAEWIKLLHMLITKGKGKAGQEKETLLVNGVC